MKGKKYTDREWLAKQFNEYKTPSLVSTMTGYPRTCVTRYAIKYGIYQKRFTRDKVNHVNEQYFNEIDTSEKAYFLGFIMADGNMYLSNNNKYQFSIKIKSSDKDILLKFAKAIEFNLEKITERNEERNGTVTTCAEIKIYNQAFCESLVALGIVPRKTGKEYMPDIPKELQKDFIRGYIDGDGWIGKDNFQLGYCSSSYTMMEQITNYIKEAVNIDMKIKQQKTIYVAKIYAKKKVYHLLKHFYYDGCISLDRKNNLAKQKIIDIYNDLIGLL